MPMPVAITFLPAVAALVARVPAASGGVPAIGGVAHAPARAALRMHHIEGESHGAPSVVMSAVAVKDLDALRAEGSRTVARREKTQAELRERLQTANKGVVVPVPSSMPVVDLDALRAEGSRAVERREKTQAELRKRQLLREGAQAVQRREEAAAVASRRLHISMLKAQGAQASAAREVVRRKFEGQLVIREREAAQAVLDRQLKLLKLKREGAQVSEARETARRKLEGQLVIREREAAQAALGRQLKLVKLKREGAEVVARRGARNDWLASTSPAIPDSPAPAGFEWGLTV